VLVVDVRVTVRCEWTESDVRLSVVLCIVAFRKAASEGLHVPETAPRSRAPPLFRWVAAKRSSLRRKISTACIAASGWPT